MRFINQVIVDLYFFLDIMIKTNKKGQPMIDLHTHSCFSDGSNTPEELIQKADNINLSAIALTDHDTVNGCPSFQKAALKYPNLIAINGCEFTTSHDATIEIIALNIKNLNPYIEFQEKLKQNRINACQQRIEKLKQMGFHISFEDVAFDSNKNLRPLVAKPHIVNFLFKTKQIPDKETGYKKLLNKGCPAYIKQKAPSANEIIDFINQTGAVSVLAHPCLINLKGQDLYEEIKRLKENGLQGIEVQHSDMSQEEMNLYNSIADELKLIKSGGSDFHGENAHHGVHLGIGKGQVNLPNHYLKKIMIASRQRD